MTARPIRIYLLDDHEVVRGGLRALLEAAGARPPRIVGG